MLLKVWYIYLKEVKIGEICVSVKSLERRNSTMDIIRIFAAFSVVAVHFFLNSGFYEETCKGWIMYIMCVLRTFFSVCIPLFMILTGYLMCKKTLCKKYYVGIVKILLIYLFASVGCALFCNEYYHTSFTLNNFIFGLFNYSMAPYSWYIELYIGLFLIIPFLNLIYNNLNSKRKKKVLLLTLFAVTVLPSVFNIFNFTGSTFWFSPEVSYTTKIVPEWWKGIYPITYYFTGCYLHEYGLKAKNVTLIISLILFVFAFGSFNFMRSYSATFESGAFIDWGGFEPFFISIVLFELFRRIRANKLPQPVRWVLWKTSNAALGIYLFSYIFDSYFYQKLSEKVENVQDRFVYFVVMVLLVFVCSLALSLITNLIIRLIYEGCGVIKSVFVTIKDENIQKGTPTEEKEEEKEEKKNKKEEQLPLYRKY